VLCNLNLEETTYHLFFECPFSTRCWNFVEISWDHVINFDLTQNANIIPKPDVICAKTFHTHHLGGIPLILTKASSSCPYGSISPTHSRTSILSQIERCIVVDVFNSLVRRELDKEFPHIQLLSARSSTPLKNFSQYHSYSYSAKLVDGVDVCPDHPGPSPC
jgi:hypothetical protein